MSNFGNINNAFSEIMLESFINKDKNKKKIVDSFISTVNENKILKTQFSIYKNITDKCESNDLKIREYIKENINLMSRFNISDIIKENVKLITSMGKSNTHIDKDYTHKQLHENINTLILFNNNKNPNNVDKIVESFDHVFNYIKNNKPVVKEPVISEAVGVIAVDKFNDKYSSISNDERAILKTLIESPADKEQTFKDVILETITLIDIKLNENVNELETKDKLLKVKDKLFRLSFNEERFISDVAKIIDLKNTLN